ncbi:MAG: flavodoxin family protein [Desulfobacteraceae bacterium]
MKPLIIYQSRTGNTIKVAKAIASIIEAEILSVDDATPKKLNNRTLIGFGSGIYWTCIDKKIYSLAAQLPKNNNVFIFITSGMGFNIMLRLYWYYIKSNFDRLGINLVGVWDCRGFDQHPTTKWLGLSKGHPDSTDIKNAKQFAKKMKSFC